MSNNQNTINELIKEAINASFKFEAIIDRTDFNSYLFRGQENESVKKSSQYQPYKKNIIKAIKYCRNIIKNTKTEVTLLQNDEDKFKNLVNKLFKAKITRLEGRRQVEWKEEKNRYIDCTRLLHSSLDSLPKENVINRKNDNSKKDILNWIRVLYYNELAICYSGFKKSSMSLGYAEESKSLLEKLYPELKNFEDLTNNRLKKLLSDLKEKIEKPSYIISLYTFALINWGEAKRTLNEIGSALKTFQRIGNIYRKCNIKKIDISPSDYFYALSRVTLILIDQGRGQEAINCLENTELKKLDRLKDYRAQQRDLEIASALIDQKEYEKAWKLLDDYIGEDFNNTFSQRQARIYQLRLMNEFRKNRPEDFQKAHKLKNFSDGQSLDDLTGIHYNKDMKNISITLIIDKDRIDNVMEVMNDEEDKSVIKNLFKKLRPDNESLEMKGIKDGYTKFENSAKGLIKISWNRKDGDSFKGACTKLAEFYQLENAEEQKNDFEKALKCFHLYLFSSKRSSNTLEGINNKYFEDWLEDWLEDKDLNILLKQYKVRYKFNPQNELENNDDENYLKAFYDAYIDHFIVNKCTLQPLKDQKRTIEKLKERLDYIYQQRDQDRDAEQIAIKFERFEDKLKKTSYPKSQAERFIKNYYFKNRKQGMHIDSISTQMNRNIIDFKEKVVGKSKVPNEYNDEVQYTLSVLRRWNSFTPTLSSSINHSKGGGYFLRFKDKNKSTGIVIDPGYNFLENFFSQGFKIGDIDFVLISHAHPDHTDDLAAILSLFHEMNGRLGEYPHQQKANKINPILILPNGVFKHYDSIINSNEEELKDIIVVEGEDRLVYPPKSSNGDLVTIYAFRTSHQDIIQSQSFGFIINVNIDNKHKAVFGYTGDIKWRPNKTKPPRYLKYLKKCDIICVHIGSVINIMKRKNFCYTFCKKYKKSDHDDRCYKYKECMKSGFKDVDITKKKLIEQTWEENHLYLAGLTMFFDELLKRNLNLKMAIISEFGEELKNGIRVDLYKKFDFWFNKRFNKLKEKPRCLPGDIGLEVDVFTGNVYCHCCKRFVDRAEIEPVPYGKEEAICFVCKECQAVLSPYQIDHILKEYCENGRKLELAEGPNVEEKSY